MKSFIKSKIIFTNNFLFKFIMSIQIYSDFRIKRFNLQRNNLIFFIIKEEF
jgi:hypothetical protein